MDFSDLEALENQPEVSDSGVTGMSKEGRYDKIQDHGTDKNKKNLHILRGL